jgi:two-component system cell cycle response regulator DivK
MAKQVLLIDDDQNIVRYLSVALSEHGYDPVTAHDGSEGLRKIEQAKPDLIVLDVLMPKKSGFVLFEQLKKDPRYEDIPIIMHTGVSGILDDLDNQKDETLEKPRDGLREILRQTIRQMRDEGLVKPEMFVEKPVDPDDFIAKVRQLIGG